MGATPSRYEDLSKNVCLNKLCGNKPIPPDDEFWNSFLSFNIRPPVTRNEQLELDSRLNTLCQQLHKNNLNTGNFGSLIQVSLERTSQLLSSIQNQNVMLTWQTYNALFSVRCIFKYFVETLCEDDVIKHTEAQPANINPNNQDHTMKIEALFEALVEIIIDVPLW